MNERTGNVVENKELGPEVRELRSQEAEYAKSGWRLNSRQGHGLATPRLSTLDFSTPQTDVHL
jgi:hypothetical protein